MQYHGKVTWVWAIVLWLTAAGCAGANDGSGYTGAGGGAFLMKENAHIRMLSEQVDIKLPDCRVRTRFVFRNDGPATTVLMVFPENGYLNARESSLDETVRRPSPHFKYFRAWVDGQRVSTRRIVKTDVSQDVTDFASWWVKRVRFARGQTRIVENRYRDRLDWGGFGSLQRSFRYILGTGASWHGNIGHAHITCDVRGIRDGGPIMIEPAGYRLAGDRVEWDQRDFKPRRDQDVTLRWIAGFVNVAINGTPVVEESGWKASWGVTPAQREGTEVWLSVQAAAGWLGAKLTVLQPGRRVRLTRGGHEAELAAGSDAIITAAGRIMLPGGARAALVHQKIYGGVAAALRPLVTSLGGTSAFDASGRLVVNMPPIRPRTHVVAGRKPSSLLAHYRFGGTGEDLTGRSSAFGLNNSHFVDDALYLDGKYEMDAARAKTPDLDYASFTVALRVKPERFIDRETNFITGGTDYRWFGMSRSKAGNLIVSLNNGDYSYELKNAALKPGVWTRIVCAVDVEAHRASAYLNGTLAGEMDLPEDFKQDVSRADLTGADKLWTFTNFSNGATFHGLVAELLLYNGALTAREIAQIPWSALRNGSK